MSNHELIRPELSSEAIPAVPGQGVGRLLPAADVVEEAESYRVELEMPGVDVSAIEVSFDQGTLSVRVPAPKPGPQGARKVLQERDRGEYFRAFNVTDSIDPGKIQADYKLGILTLTLPKAEAAKPRKIPVRSR